MKDLLNPDVDTRIQLDSTSAPRWRRAAALGVLAGVLPALLGGCLLSNDDPQAPEETGAAALALETAPLDFGGAWGYINGAPTTNGATGAQSCPAGYTPQQVLGTNNTDYAVYNCYRSSQSGQAPYYDFGGMWGYVNQAPANNPITQGQSCPPGYSDQQLLGTNNVDYPLHVCLRQHSTGTPEYLFGGMFGYVGGVAAPNPATGTNSCPSGFVQTKVLGTYNVDYDLSFCYQTVPPVPMDFGGMYGYVSGQPQVNPATNGMSCPPDYTPTTVYGTNNVDYELTYCWRRHIDGRDPFYDFGGMWGYVNGTMVPVPTTSDGNCPTGYTDRIVLGTTNTDWGLHFCYQAHQSGAAVRLFGGMYGTRNGTASKNPATGASSCPTGYTARKVLDTSGVDYPLYYCDAP